MKAINPKPIKKQFAICNYIRSLYEHLTIKHITTISHQSLVISNYIRPLAIITLISLATISQVKATWRTQPPTHPAEETTNSHSLPPQIDHPQAEEQSHYPSDPHLFSQPPSPFPLHSTHYPMYDIFNSSTSSNPF